MKTNRGKGYFYAMGQRDGDHFESDGSRQLLMRLVNRKDWPEWAKYAYIYGLRGWAL